MKKIKNKGIIKSLTPSKKLVKKPSANSDIKSLRSKIQSIQSSTHSTITLIRIRIDHIMKRLDNIESNYRHTNSRLDKLDPQSE